jgi:hypothetical protein
LAIAPGLLLAVAPEIAIAPGTSSPLPRIVHAHPWKRQGKRDGSGVTRSNARSFFLDCRHSFSIGVPAHQQNTTSLT